MVAWLRASLYAFCVANLGRWLVEGPPGTTEGIGPVGCKATRDSCGTWGTSAALADSVLGPVWTKVVTGGCDPDDRSVLHGGGGAP